MNNEEKILVGILVQQNQPITAKELIDKASDVGYALDYDEVIYVLKNMQRKDLVSVVYKNSKGMKLEGYGMSKPMFKNCPETAHLKDMLPTLVKDKAASKFLKALEEQSSDSKKVKELSYRDYKKVTIKLLTTEKIVGGSLNKPQALPADVEAAIKGADDVDNISYFNRDSSNTLVFTRNQVRQYFMKNLRLAGLGETAVNQIYFNEAVIQPNGHKYSIEQWPIIINGMGRGVKNAECLPAGVEITTSFVFPFKGTKITTEDQLKSVINFFTANGVGFSSYAKKYGRCTLVDFKVENIF